VTLAAPAALWGLLAIPFLILLYLLRVRRKDHPVSSVLLWQRSAPTLAAVRPSKRIERSLLLLLQILATAAVVAALARPSLVVSSPDRGDIMLVLDLSLSMRARDVSPTRFERARAEALDLVARLRPGQRSGIVVAGLRAQLLVPLTGERARVIAALRGIEPWDVAGDVRGAVLMAAEYPRGRTGGVQVWTDGARGGLPALPGVTYRILGTSDDNIGITTFRIARDPRGTEALLRVDNFSGRARQVPVTVTHDRETVYHATVDVPAGGTRTLVFPVSGTGEFRARLDAHDLLPEDDVASAVLDPAPLPSVLLVSEGNPYLERVLQVLPVSRAAATRSTDPATWASYGVVILDRIDPGPVPPGDYLLIASLPSNLPITATGELRHPEVSMWERTDPVLQFVDLGSIRISRAMALAGGAGGRTLAGGDAPLLWAYEGGGIRALLLGFALQDSDLPQRVAFPVLVANSLAWLGGEAIAIRAGESLQVPAGAGASAELIGPHGHREVVQAESGMFPLPPLTRAGVYQLKTPSETRAIAVRPADSTAGLIRPGGPSAAAPRADGPGDGRGAGLGPPVRTQLPVWPWLVLAAVAAASCEWALATRRRGGDA
jgi:Ca-activated chloride channel homolog